MYLRVYNSLGNGLNHFETAAAFTAPKRTQVFSWEGPRFCSGGARVNIKGARLPLLGAYMVEIWVLTLFFSFLFFFVGAAAPTKFSIAPPLRFVFSRDYGVWDDLIFPHFIDLVV